MAVKKFKPTTPSLRHTTIASFEEITSKKPLKSLLDKKTSSGGRNNVGRMTARHLGGGHKRKYRIIDFKRDKFDVPGRVDEIAYDPNRSARIALIVYKDGEKRYILAPDGLAVGATIVSSNSAEPSTGNSIPLRNIPLGYSMHNIELQKGKGGQLVRSAGGSAQIMAKEGKYAHVRLPSKEVRLILLDCRATIGQVGNIEHDGISLGKAGRKRWLGRRPHVRGVVMNPVDHPMGGGEGRSSGGRHPCSPNGIPAKGFKTRKKNKHSDKYILRRRKA